MVRRANMIKDIKIEHVDTESLFGSRILKITTTKNRFETPSRVMSSTENRYKKDLALSPLDDRGNLPIHVYEYIKGYREESSIKKLHRNNGFLKEQLTQIDNNLRGYDNALTLITFQYPSNTILTEEDIDSLIYLQCRSTADCISIPEMNSGMNSEKFLHILERSRKFIEKFGKEPVPLIYMESENRDLFCKKIDAIVKAEFKMITLKYASFDRYFPNYSYVRKIAEDHKVIFHITGVPRVIPTSRANYVHIPPIFRIDLSTPRTPFVGGEIKTKKPYNTRRFDPLSLGNLSLLEHKKEYGEKLLCTCPVCKNRNLDNYMKDYTTCPNIKVKNPIYLYSRLHEIFASLNELEQEKEHINKSQTDEYVANKKYLKESISGLTEKMKTKTLDEFF